MGGILVALIGISLFGGAADRGSPSPGAAFASASPSPPRTPPVTAVLQPSPTNCTAPVPSCPPVLRIANVSPTGGTPRPDVAGALPGDDGTGPLPLGTINGFPNPDRLDFLFELCSLGCYRDAHWIDPGDTRRGSGIWTANRPFHVREGFVNNGTEPLGAGFEVVLYVTQLKEGERAPTHRFTSDFVLRGTSDRCGPTYRMQARPTTCEWFVHDFPTGLAAGRWAIWAVWEAPCWSWLKDRLISWCEDPDSVVALFSSGFDAPYDQWDPSYISVSA